MQNKFIIFDLDGTISDPKDGIVGSINYSLAVHGFVERSDNELIKYIGPPLDKVFEELADNSDKKQILSLVSKYRERYAKVGYTENTLYDGILESLEKLALKYPLALCTSKRADFAHKIISLFQIDHLFKIVSGGDVGISKTQQLSELLANGTIGPNSIMVGDRNADLIGAHNNKLESVGVLWGYGDYQELIKESPSMILETPQQLSEKII